MFPVRMFPPDMVVVSSVRSSSRITVPSSLSTLKVPVLKFEAFRFSTVMVPASMVPAVIAEAFKFSTSAFCAFLN